MSAKSSGPSSYYEILELDPNATGRDVHMAYMRAKETYSPDSPALYTMFTPDEARQLLKMIDEAFAVLSNQVKRQEYDLSLARRGHPAFASLLNIAQSDKPKPKLVSAPSPGGGESATQNSSRTFGLRDPLPEGFARTRFSVYEINAPFEEELNQIEECDGAFLQKIRQYKNVKLEQVSEATRISKSYLGALESNAFEALPATVFVRGFVLQVVRTLGVPERLVDAYMKRFRKTQG
jgi:curved DNA-binding protein CbpA